MTIPHSRLVRQREGELRSVFDEGGYAYPTFSTAALPDRVYSGMDPDRRPPSTSQLQAQIDFDLVRSPLQSLLAAKGPPTLEDTRNSLLRLEAAWLVGDDRFNLLDVGDIEPLPHQLSLVEHVATNPELRRVLIADEVGLGKTVEVALLLRRLASEDKAKRLRVLYLTEARLVDNVAEEFGRAGLEVSRWSVEAQEATLSPDVDEGIVIASMHRGVATANHVATLEASGPWDVVVVDEAHHLTDWSEDGRDPQRRMRLVRRIVANRLRDDGRVILLSGTPHQGHSDRFRNVLRLLDEDLEDHEKARGRVIYRIKEDIAGWDGAPLFPNRVVHPPTEVEVSADYRRWLKLVSEMLSADTMSRAAAWRRTQALEWCASSPEAGLAYLCRLAIRAGIGSARFPPLRRALTAIRPYRGGAAEEPIAELEARIVDTKDEPGAAGLDRTAFETVIALGVRLVESNAVAAKLGRILGWVREAPTEKFVVFAQPVDTVHLVARRLESELGPGSVSLVVGGQTTEERRREIDRFRRRGRTRVLVSSRSGGEGINLQVSRNLVHFDVPWNPMELEQRVGRVHRYGGFQTVHVRTLVLAGSREERVLARCRARLAQAVRDLDLDRLETLFARTMSMVDVDELASLMADENFGPLKPSEEERIDRIVQEGFGGWQQADATFRDLASTLPELKRGPVRDEDLASFLSRAPGITFVDSWKILEDAVRSRAQGPAPTVPVFKMPDGSKATTARVPGSVIAIPGPDAEDGIRNIGLNDPAVAAAIREALDGARTRAEPSGVAEVQIPRATWSRWQGDGILGPEWAACVLHAYVIRSLHSNNLNEIGVSFHCALATLDGLREVRLDEESAAMIIRTVRAAKPLTRVVALDAAALASLEQRRLVRLAGPAAGALRAVFPIAIVVMAPEVDEVLSTP